MIRILYFLLTIFMTTQTWAAEDPVTIEAQNALEWHREKQQYIARGDAVATRGPDVMKADLMIANYLEEDGKNVIQTLISTDNVTLTSDGGTAYGDKGVYQVEEEIFTLTGKDLKLITETETITAIDNMIYYGLDQKFVANRDVVVVNEQNTIYTDQLTALFEEDDKKSDRPTQESEQGPKQNVKEYIAKGSVKIVTPTDVVTGKRANYNPKDGKAIVYQDVVLTRGENKLFGDRAVVDLNTGISQLFADKSVPNSRGRVYGVFYPNNKDKKSDQTSQENTNDTSSTENR